MIDYERRWDSATKRAVALVVLVFLALVIYRFRGVLTPLIMSLLLGLILDPVVDFVEMRTRMGRTTVTALVFVVVVLIVIAAPVVAAPPLMRAANSLRAEFAKIMVDMEQFLAQPIELLGQEWDLQSMYDEVSTAFEALVSVPTVAAGTFKVVLGFASTLFWGVFIFLCAFYLVKDADRLGDWLDSLAPTSSRDDFVRLRQQITEVWQAFLRGQLIMALLLALMTTLVDAAVGLPHALALGLLAGVMEFVPNVGPLIAAAPAVMVAIFEGSIFLPMSTLWFAVLVLVLYLVIQQIEGNVLLPRVLGQSLNLHPLVVLVAVILGGSLAGIVGVLLAAPTIATVRVLGNYIYCRLTDRDPFPQRPIPPKRRDNLWLRLWSRVQRRMLADKWQVRPATAEDRTAVESLCARIWDGNDYVPGVWNDWLADPYGELTVAELKGRVVAIGKLSRLAEGEWWLEGLRVDPNYRRLGGAGAVQSHQVHFADRVGEGVVRLGTVSDNQAVRRILKRDGFERLAALRVYRAEPLPGNCPLEPISESKLDEAWELIDDSLVLQAAGGLYEATPWHWMEMTRERLATHLRNGDVWGTHLQEELAAIAIVMPDRREGRLLGAYLDGTEEGLKALAWGLRVKAGAEGYELLRIRPPAYLPLLRALETAGVTRDWDNELWLFERPLGVSEEN